MRDVTGSATVPTGVRRLDPDDLPALQALQDVVAAGASAGFLFDRAPDALRADLVSGRRVAFGISEDDALVAAALLNVPTAHEPHRGMPFPLVPEADMPRHACFLENTIVLPAARGRGHHHALIDARIAHAAAAGMRWICAGVHLANTVSWANLLAHDLRIVGIRFDYGYPVIGLLRPAQGSPLGSDPDDRCDVAAADGAAHDAALRDGYVGVALRAGEVVRYEKRIER